MLPRHPAGVSHRHHHKPALPHLLTQRSLHQHAPHHCLAHQLHCITPPLPLVQTGKATFQLRQQLLSEVTRIKPAPAESHELFPVTLAQLDTLVQRQLCPVQCCRNRVTVTRSGDTLQTVCKECHTVVTSASPPTWLRRQVCHETTTSILQPHDWCCFCRQEITPGTRDRRKNEEGSVVHLLQVT